MKKIRKILNNLGPAALVATATVIILALVRQQPAVSGGRNKTPPPVTSVAAANRELTEMRAEALLPLLQRAAQKNTGVFTVNAADTSGNNLNIRITDAAAGRTVFFGNRNFTPEQQSLLQKNGISISGSTIQLPLQRKNGVLVVRMPAAMAFALAGL